MSAHRLLLAGHTHVQCLKTFGPKAFCNPGSVGQPRDGNPGAAFCILDGDRVELKRVPYDIDAMAAAVQACGLDEHFYKHLYMGSRIGGRVDEIV